MEICVYVGDPCHRLAFTVEICVLVWSLRWRSVFYSGFYGEDLCSRVQLMAWYLFSRVSGVESELWVLIFR